MFCCLIFWPNGVAFTIQESRNLNSNTSGDCIDSDGRLKKSVIFLMQTGSM